MGLNQLPSRPRENNSEEMVIKNAKNERQALQEQSGVIPKYLEIEFYKNIDKNLKAIGDNALQEFDKKFHEHSNSVSGLANVQLDVSYKLLKAAIYKITNDYWRKAIAEGQTDQMELINQEAERELKSLVDNLEGLLNLYTKSGPFTYEAVHKLDKQSAALAKILAASANTPLKQAFTQFLQSNEVPAPATLVKLNEIYLDNEDLSNFYLTFLARLPSSARVNLLKSLNHEKAKNLISKATTGKRAADPVFSAVEIMELIEDQEGNTLHQNALLSDRELSELDKNWQIANDTKYPSTFDGRGRDLNGQTVMAYGIQAYSAATIGANVMANLAYNRRELIQDPSKIFGRLADIATNEYVLGGVAGIVFGDYLKNPDSFSSKPPEQVAKDNRFIRLHNSLDQRQFEKFFFPESSKNDETPLEVELAAAFSFYLKSQNNDLFPEKFDPNSFLDFITLYKADPENSYGLKKDEVLDDLLASKGIIDEQKQSEKLEEIAEKFKKLKNKHKFIEYLKMFEEQEIGHKKAYDKLKKQYKNIHAQKTMA